LQLNALQERAVTAARAGLRERGLTPAIVTHDLALALGLELLLPETVILCIQRSTAVDHVRESGITVFCLSEHVPPAEVAGLSSSQLLEHPAARAFLASTGPVALLAFKPTDRVERAVETAGGVLLSGDPTVARRFENKLVFPGIARQAGLDTPRWRVTRGVPAIADLSAEFGLPCVLQGARGNAGQRTYFVHAEEDLAEVRRREGVDAQLRVAEYVDGVPLTASGVCDEHGMRSWVEPCRQVTGVSWLTPMPLGSCGNAWGDLVAVDATARAHQAVAAIGAELGKAGYRGLYGVDFVAAEERLVVIETNPRMVASIPLATQMEVEAGRVPLLLTALLTHLGTHPGEQVAGGELGAATQLIVHSLPGEAERPPFPSGAYAISNGAVRFEREAAWLRDIHRDEALLLSRQAGEPVTETREYARIFIRSPLGENAPAARPLVRILRDA
jgi:hypothetical protein